MSRAATAPLWTATTSPPRTTRSASSSPAATRRSRASCASDGRSRSAPTTGTCPVGPVAAAGSRGSAAGAVVEEVVFDAAVRAGVADRWGVADADRWGVAEETVGWGARPDTVISRSPRLERSAFMAASRLPVSTEAAPDGGTPGRGSRMTNGEITPITSFTPEQAGCPRSRRTSTARREGGDGVIVVCHVSLPAMRRNRPVTQVEHHVDQRREEHGDPGDHADRGTAPPEDQCEQPNPCQPHPGRTPTCRSVRPARAVPRTLERRRTGPIAPG